MNYRLSHEGRELGTFPIEDLRRRRTKGELTGAEWVWGEGMSQWQPLDVVLQSMAAGSPPPLPGAPSEKFRKVIWAVAAVGTVFFIAVFAVAVWRGIELTRASFNRARNITGSSGLSGGATPSNPDAMEAASKTVVWTTNTWTQRDVERQAKEFCLRQWRDAYRQHGNHGAPYDTDAAQMIESWIEENHGDGRITNLPPAMPLADKLAANPDCNDPLVLTITADLATNETEQAHRFERALRGFENSSYRGYPKFYVTVFLMNKKGKDAAERPQLEKEALKYLGEALSDGSFEAVDQQTLADIFLDNWGHDFYSGNRSNVIGLAAGAGKDFKWLWLVLDGEDHIGEAWAARGGDYANTVTQQGWQGFNKNLKIAREDFMAAWNLHHEFPRAPARMIYVCLGDSDIKEMRTWFDRAVADQIDYEGAWSEIRWGLRPRWYGDEASMLAFGVTALNTGRFDTDVPRKFYDSMSDVEQEEEVDAGTHIYGRSDIWPNLQKMYEGYIAEPSQEACCPAWRTSYAGVAYFAGKYDIARAQLEALNWQPLPTIYEGGNADASLIPWEVAARTGPLKEQIMRAEEDRDNGNIADSLALYTKLKDATNADKRTQEFIWFRMAALQCEKNLAGGQWVDFMPTTLDDANWYFRAGTARIAPDGALEIQGEGGHFIFSRARVGREFEIKGTIEVACVPGKSYQTGILMGMPMREYFDWNSFRIRGHNNGRCYTTFGNGFTRSETTHELNSTVATNSFDFTYSDSKATATVNVVQVYNKVAEPQTLRVPDNMYLLGFGGIENSGTTIIRYRNIQVRKLKTSR